MASGDGGSAVRTPSPPLLPSLALSYFSPEALLVCALAEVSVAAKSLYRYRHCLCHCLCH